LSLAADFRRARCYLLCTVFALGKSVSVYRSLFHFHRALSCSMTEENYIHMARKILNYSNIPSSSYPHSAQLFIPTIK
jgi:hypothetical protein